MFSTDFAAFLHSSDPQHRLLASKNIEEWMLSPTFIHDSLYIVRSHLHYNHSDRKFVCILVKNKIISSFNNKMSIALDSQFNGLGESLFKLLCDESFSFIHEIILICISYLMLMDKTFTNYLTVLVSNNDTEWKIITDFEHSIAQLNVVRSTKCVLECIPVSVESLQKVSSILNLIPSIFIALPLSPPSTSPFETPDSYYRMQHACLELINVVCEGQLKFNVEYLSNFISQVITDVTPVALGMISRVACLINEGTIFSALPALEFLSKSLWPQMDIKKNHQHYLMSQAAIGQILRFLDQVLKFDDKRFWSESDRNDVCKKRLNNFICQSMVLLSDAVALGFIKDKSTCRRLISLAVAALCPSGPMSAFCVNFTSAGHQLTESGIDNMELIDFLTENRNVMLHNPYFDIQARNLILRCISNRTRSGFKELEIVNFIVDDFVKQSKKFTTHSSLIALLRIICPIANCLTSNCCFFDGSDTDASNSPSPFSNISRSSSDLSVSSSLSFEEHNNLNISETNCHNILDKQTNNNFHMDEDVDIPIIEMSQETSSMHVHGRAYSTSIGSTVDFSNEEHDFNTEDDISKLVPLRNLLPLIIKCLHEPQTRIFSLFAICSLAPLVHLEEDVRQIINIGIVPLLQRSVRPILESYAILESVATFLPRLSDKNDKTSIIEMFLNLDVLLNFPPEIYSASHSLSLLLLQIMHLDFKKFFVEGSRLHHLLIRIVESVVLSCEPIDDHLMCVLCLLHSDSNHMVTINIQEVLLHYLSQMTSHCADRAAILLVPLIAGNFTCLSPHSLEISLLYLSTKSKESDWREKPLTEINPLFCLAHACIISPHSTSGIRYDLSINCPIFENFPIFASSLRIAAIMVDSDGCSQITQWLIKAINLGGDFHLIRTLTYAIASMRSPWPVEFSNLSLHFIFEILCPYIENHIFLNARIDIPVALSAIWKCLQAAAAPLHANQSNSLFALKSRLASCLSTIEKIPETTKSGSCLDSILCLKTNFLSCTNEVAIMQQILGRPLPVSAHLTLLHHFSSRMTRAASFFPHSIEKDIIAFPWLSPCGWAVRMFTECIINSNSDNCVGSALSTQDVCIAMKVENAIVSIQSSLNWFTYRDPISLLHSSFNIETYPYKDMKVGGKSSTYSTIPSDDSLESFGSDFLFNPLLKNHFKRLVSDLLFVTI